MIEATDVGNFRHQITLRQIASSPPDASGQRVPVYSTYATTRAKIEGISSREIERAKSFSENTTHKVTIRYRTGVTHTMQVLFGARTFLITGILNPEERNVRLELFCTELVA